MFCACMCVSACARVILYVLCVGAFGDRKRAPGPLEMGLQAVMSYHTGARN